METQIIFIKSLNILVQLKEYENEYGFNMIERSIGF